LFAYGLPSKVEHDVTLLDVGGRDSERSKRIKKKNATITFWAYTGLILIGLGFLFQLLAVFFKTV